MKNLLLIALICCFAGAYGQQIDKSKYKKSGVAPKEGISVIEYQNSKQDLNYEEPEFNVPVTTQNAGAVSTIEIGQAGNTWGFAYNRTTYLWVSNAINSVSFVHRMEALPGTGFLAFDFSKDGGQTWSLNNQVYDPELQDAYNARYPQGVLYNPAGNTDPENAFVHYFAPTLDGSNTAGSLNWGGYTWGSMQMAQGSAPTQTNQPSTGNFHQFLPSGLELTQLGDMWMLDEENVDDGAGTHVYNDKLILGHGIWNEETSDFEYAFEHFDCEVYDDKFVNDAKIAFAPDGMTGWMVVMSQLDDPLPQTTMHPILFKTEDGGETWDDDPIEIQLGGEDGIPEIVNFITDEYLEWFYDPEPVPPRTEIDYFMGYHVDIAVDAWGNPHLCGLVAIADADDNTWWHAEGLMAEFHLWSEDGGDTWRGHKLWDQKRFDAEWTAGSSTVNMYNRPQVGTSSDGVIVFFSWLDTEIDEVEDNSSPDIFFSDYQPAYDLHPEEATNVTAFSAAMWNARWGAMSRYAFTEITVEGYECTIPWVYQEMTDDDPAQPVQFYYIPDFVMEYPSVGISKPEMNPVSSVSQNYPNPANETTNIRINLIQTSNVVISVHNLTGQTLKEIDFGSLNNGAHELTIPTKDLTEGLYFYTVKAGKDEITKKMIVQ